MEERLQKILSRHGIASRRKAEELIAARRVRVNGNTAQLGDTADEQTDVIEIDGVRLKRAAPEHLYIQRIVKEMRIDLILQCQILRLPFIEIHQLR